MVAIELVEENRLEDPAAVVPPETVEPDLFNSFSPDLDLALNGILSNTFRCCPILSCSKPVPYALESGLGLKRVEGGEDPGPERGGGTICTFFGEG